MNTGNMSNDEVNAIGNFIEQLNNLNMKGIVFNTDNGVVIRYNYHPDFKCRDSNEELPYEELPLHPDDLTGLYWNYTNGVSYDFDIVEEIKDPKGYGEYPSLVKYAKLKSIPAVVHLDNFWKLKFVKVTDYWYDNEKPNMEKIEFILTTRRRFDDLYEKRKALAKGILYKVTELFHLQETTDWEEKAINEILKHI